jgi:hypothetical protein
MATPHVSAGALFVDEHEWVLLVEPKGRGRSHGDSEVGNLN